MEEQERRMKLLMFKHEIYSSSSLRQSELKSLIQQRIKNYLKSRIERKQPVDLDHPENREFIDELMKEFFKLD